MKKARTLITPEIAERFLKFNECPAKMSPVVVNRLSIAMHIGAFNANDAVITLYGGALTDGQHILAAIIDSGLPQKIHVVENPKL